MPSPKPATGKRAERKRAMLWAYLTFHMKHQPQEARERICWMLLLEWAAAGGKPDEVIRA